MNTPDLSKLSIQDLIKFYGILEDKEDAIKESIKDKLDAIKQLKLAVERQASKLANFEVVKVTWENLPTKSGKVFPGNKRDYSTGEVIRKLNISPKINNTGEFKKWALANAPELLQAQVYKEAFLKYTKEHNGPPPHTEIYMEYETTIKPTKEAPIYEPAAPTFTLDDLA